MTGVASFTNRHIEWQTVTRIESDAVTGSSGYTAGAPAEVIDRLSVGDEYAVETFGGFFGTICGWNIGGEWIARKSDQQIEQDRQDYLEESARRRRESLAANRGEWIGREEMLPGWLKERIHVFHERGGEQFELDGWGYELVVCEIAALYAETGCEDTEATDAYAREHGTSGNQHDCAKALVRAHLRGQSIAGTVSALSPITGDAFYAGSAS